MQKTRSSNSFWKNNASLFLGIVIFFAILTLIYFLDSRYRIKTIKVVKNGKETYSLKGLGQFEGAGLIFLSENKASSKIMRLNPFLKESSVIKVYPDSLEVIVTYQVPAAQLKVNEGYLLLSGSGTILVKSHEETSDGLPKIAYYQAIPFQNYQAGQNILFKDIVDSLYFLDVLQKLGFKINSIDIAGFYMLGLYTNEKKFYFSSEKSINDQVYLLEASVRELKIAGDEFATLDVRYDNPVITY
ncbi:hypothetical protein A3A93_00770 [Candidatus Roizmanbacteria bacterium RIFCSPLOWO2_01_FULL_38_12]|uniref:POTRA domain-containing protein n=1 Tax=Candidatus Roizmanbacteria bacterium RIFCSPLOWO2_01_FULL_38_12 TaxID=1802061 RepID=A0A1F7IVM4_9BACT|nr:MAG: hypothetical protein A2861_04360 [Candidatus Roizmanbacteria bacterium RIFCSPHIGHO2_01_FULL_38_15]OGK47394.1 MAG: hypothetical protein A3A93_00770 [Candidatus Roizmanbacteria bacterium RIFCSPLOWO2_01_FULL_38_12]